MLTHRARRSASSAAEVAGERLTDVGTDVWLHALLTAATHGDHAIAAWRSTSRRAVSQYART